MVKAMLKLSKATYVIGLLSMCKIWVKSRALNLNLTYPSASWKLELTNS
jgi:hypothetical protein